MLCLLNLFVCHTSPMKNFGIRNMYSCMRCFPPPLERAKHARVRPLPSPTSNPHWITVCSSLLKSISNKEEAFSKDSPSPRPTPCPLSTPRKTTITYFFSSTPSSISSSASSLSPRQGHKVTLPTDFFLAPVLNAPSHPQQTPPRPNHPHQCNNTRPLIFQVQHSLQQPPTLSLWCLLFMQDDADCDASDIVCANCLSGETNEDNDILICDGDHNKTVGYHQKCCEPPVINIPDHSWFCPECAIQRSTVDSRLQDSDYAPSVHAAFSSATCTSTSTSSSSTDFDSDSPSPDSTSNGSSSRCDVSDSSDDSSNS